MTEKFNPRMNIEEFKKYAEKNDDNLVTKWNYNKFKFICQKCKSKNVKVVSDLTHHEGDDCPTCGYDSYNTGKIIIKCLNCGQGMQVLNVEDLSDKY
jgi:DNA-directed RNA polymerase subunit RPC12/RpoP